MTVTTDDFLETRRSLVARLKSWDDDESWRQFLKLYGRLIHSVASQAGLTEQEAEEAVQAVEEGTDAQWSFSMTG